MASVIQTVGIVFGVAVLLTVVVVIVIGLLKPKRSQPDEESADYPLYPPLDGVGGSE
ncbi:hypothetical protein GCM10022225_63010 [Plantactinospora mayteni]|uniref:Uncharacterized protein n=1 Tax=Plantactinospora mayteni TaxID=566021 RepID=A0ABQ4EZ94_9ACTN|nr:hypothetical protein Pma05_65290 [Plantactinospora mayteni]